MNQNERNVNCPSCENDEAKEFGSVRSDGVTRYEGICPACHSEWEHFEDSLGRSHEFRFTHGDESE